MLEIRDKLFNSFDKRLHRLADGQDRTIIDQLNDLNAGIEDIQDRINIFIKF